MAFVYLSINIAKDTYNDVMASLLANSSSGSITNSTEVDVSTISFRQYLWKSKIKMDSSSIFSVLGF